MVEVLGEIQTKELKELFDCIHKKNIKENYKISNEIIKILKINNKKFEFENEDPRKFFGEETNLILKSTIQIKTKSENNLRIWEHPMISIAFIKERNFNRNSLKLYYRKENFEIIKTISKKKISWFKSIDVEVIEKIFSSYSHYQFNFFDKDRDSIIGIISQMKADGVDTYYIKTINTIVSNVNLLISKLYKDLILIKGITKEKIINSKVEVDYSTDELLKLLHYYQNNNEFSEKHIEDILKVIEFSNFQLDNINLIKKTLGKVDFDTKENIEVLELMIKSYNSLLFLSYCFLKSISTKDFIVYHQIRNSFDKFNVFNSNYQNIVISELNDINKNLKIVINTIKKSEQNLITEIKHLSEKLSENFQLIGERISTDLNTIDSSIKWNNFLSVIQTYQLYKINKQTKMKK